MREYRNRPAICEARVKKSTRGNARNFNQYASPYTFASGGTGLKGIVAYDSVHGSTKAVAEAIAEQITSEGHQAQLIAVKQWAKGPLVGDFLFVGSPTRGGKMTNEAKDFIESLDPAYWKGKKVVTFDTVGPLSKDAEKRKKTLASMNDKNAASRMKDICEQRGIHVDWVMHFAVVGMWGPIAPDGPQMAKDLTHGFLGELK
jgi:flavodoxin